MVHILRGSLSVSASLGPFPSPKDRDHLSTFVDGAISSPVEVFQVTNTNRLKHGQSYFVTIDC